MTIRNVQDNDYENLVMLFKDFFKTHNIFQQSNEEIINYLKKQSEENELIIYEENNSIHGALFLVNFGQNSEGTHKLWKFRHFTFTSEEIAIELLKEAENRTKNNSKTSKIELTISETEEGIEFYKNNGYEEEGALKNHYRNNETCFILSKSFS